MDGQAAFDMLEAEGSIVEKNRVEEFIKIEKVDNIIRVDKNRSGSKLKNYIVSGVDKEALDGWVSFFKNKKIPFIVIDSRTAVHVWKECYDG